MTCIIVSSRSPPHTKFLTLPGDPARYGAGTGSAAAPLSHRAVHRARAGISGAARRTLRTNLRFVARRVVPYLDPADAPLPRGRAKAPYTAADIAGYLALADAQPTTGRRLRATALVCLGAGAGLIRSDLRNARGTDVTARSGGLVVGVRGPGPAGCPCWPATSPGWPRATFAGDNFLTGGAKPERGNITNPLTRSLAGGGGLPPLDTSRLRATWLAESRAARPADVHARRRDLLLPAARRHHRRPGSRHEQTRSRCSAATVP